MQLLEKYNVMVKQKKGPFLPEGQRQILSLPEPHQTLHWQLCSSVKILSAVLSILIHQDPINGLVSQQVVPVSPLITIFLCDRLEITQSIFASKGPQIQFAFHIIEGDRRRSVFQPEDLSCKIMKEKINLYVIWETKKKKKEEVRNKNIV